MDLPTRNRVQTPPCRRLVAAGVITCRGGRTVQITRTANGGRGEIRPAVTR